MSDLTSERETQVRGGDQGDAEAPQSLADSAYAQLREKILTVELWPGATFSENEIVEQLGLGKTPVREALLRLRLGGLVEVRPRAGYEVAPATLKGTRDSLELRGILDAAAAALSATRPEAGEALRDLNLQLLAAVPTSVGERVEADRRFHLFLARVGRNEALAEAVERSFAEYTRLAHLAAAIDAAATPPAPDHSELVEAIASGDSTAAHELARAEARDAELRISQALISSDSLATTNVAPEPANRFYLDIPKSSGHGEGKR